MVVYVSCRLIQKRKIFDFYSSRKAQSRHPHSGHSSLVLHAADEIVDLSDLVRLHVKVVGITAGEAAPFLVGADEVFASHADTPIRAVKRSFSVIRMMSLNCFTRSALML